MYVLWLTHHVLSHSAYTRYGQVKDAFRVKLISLAVPSLHFGFRDSPLINPHTYRRLEKFLFWNRSISMFGRRKEVLCLNRRILNLST